MSLWPPSPFCRGRCLCRGPLSCHSLPCPDGLCSTRRPSGPCCTPNKTPSSLCSSSAAPEWRPSGRPRPRPPRRAWRSRAPSGDRGSTLRPSAPCCTPNKTPSSLCSSSAAPEWPPPGRACHSLPCPHCPCSTLRPSGPGCTPSKTPSSRRNRWVAPEWPPLGRSHVSPICLCNEASGKAARRSHPRLRPPPHRRAPRSRAPQGDRGSTPRSSAPSSTLCTWPSLPCSTCAASLAPNPLAPPRPRHLAGRSTSQPRSSGRRRQYCSTVCPSLHAEASTLIDLEQNLASYAKSSEHKGRSLGLR
mmetsp:Transcript_29108/g.84284  ORF Transcript_29108/g.84284 Transcript_29108/m.84284 type:complete len:303 (+) Transcript_29108:128-1036(+)